jgi:hypothetical protein
MGWLWRLSIASLDIRHVDLTGNKIGVPGKVAASAFH